MRRTKPDYGLDAPGLIRIFIVAGAIAAVAALAAGLTLSGWRPWGTALTAIATLLTVYLLGMGSYMVYGSKVVKVRGREELLDAVAWRGDERVLDVGCGRGLMLVGAARRLSTGRAVGIDIWRASDQSANTADAALTNAECEGVADRVEVRTADMRHLPFADASVDVVVSHWAVHNLADAADRARALGEIARVLAPSGILILADIEHRQAYRDTLAALGLTVQPVIVSPLADAIRGIVSFGSFRPATIVARRGADVTTRAQAVTIRSR